MVSSLVPLLTALSAHAGVGLVVDDGPVAREIAHGWYLRADVGFARYLGTYVETLRRGTVMGLRVGNEFSVHDGGSTAWELGVHHGVFRGMSFEAQSAANVPAASRLQGNTITIGMTAALLHQVQLSPRVGLGVRAGVGLVMVPLLVQPDFWQSEVIEGAWLGEVPGPLPVYQRQALPLVLAGSGVEYATRLSHVSVGFEAELSYTFGFDLGAGAHGFAKYTF